MKETSKAIRRRVEEDRVGSFDWKTVFTGHGIDVGSDDDPLRNCTNRIADSDQALSFNLPDGGGDDLTKHFKKEEFNFIHASQVLEHALDPVVMLRSWVECLKSGGFICATTPDFKRYEKSIWPSLFNVGHKSIWSLDENAISVGSIKLNPSHKLHTISRPIACKLPEWLKQFGCEILLCRLVDTNYDYSQLPDVDQTYSYHMEIECFLEFVLKK